MVKLTSDVATSYTWMCDIYLGKTSDAAEEFVRNHQYSLQILAHCKQNRDFDKLLKHYESKPDCEERTLETFLTYPMFQVNNDRHQRR
ncbi:hypothetical protein QTP70_009085 [Hemibagrus guttatus]|uniref:DH domain-containing protein n=1 Tax=Hemibagrus guttatus TaxID=175788 RepID=A0AAE0VCF1_9TELE|nr:hypothetical protein QTP70_009085 [Hemibagrus guttatus]